MITKDQIEHLAKLAKLDVTEDEKSKYAEQISSILVYFKQLDEIDVSQVEATDHITAQQNITRPDEAFEICDSKKVLAAAPDVHERHVRVKAVFNDD